MAESFAELQQAMTTDKQHWNKMQAQITQLTPNRVQFENQYKIAAALSASEEAMQT